MRVLIAEDDLTSRMILAAILKKWGYDPVTVSDGTSAWQLMQEPTAPCMAILDWEMPGMDGLEVCRRIRDGYVANPPYIIILTARGETADIVKGLDAGANDYISKPYDNDELWARLRVGQRMLELQAELLEAKNTLAHDAAHDSLTGILNRRAILDGLNKELMRANRKYSTLSVGLCDIDHFKMVNDTYGHQAGDEVLCGFAAVAQNCFRGYDLVGRYGGEEFLVITPESSGRGEEGLYERLRVHIAGHPILTKSGVLRITVSIGVAEANGNGTVDGVLAAADAALYRAKAGGRNRVAYAADYRGKESGQGRIVDKERASRDEKEESL